MYVREHNNWSSKNQSGTAPCNALFYVITRSLNAINDKIVSQTKVIDH